MAPHPPPSLIDYLSTQLAASVPGKHDYALHVVRSEPQRSHALFPHATNAKHAKVWHEETLVVLSERRPVPQDAPRGNAAADGTEQPRSVDAETGAAANGEGATASSLSTAPSDTVASTSAATAPPATDSTPESRSNPAAERTHVALIPIAALEASLYFVPSSSCALLYISKVDTTGLSTSPHSPTRTLVSAYIAHALAHPPHGARRLRVHVFARAQGQYLFPGSVDNTATKRVLDDKGLVRWWKATLERACVAAKGESNAAVDPLRWYLVPGLAYLESLPYVPATPGWTYGHPYSSLSSPLHPPSDAPTAHPVPDHVPAFPDDPKSRFLHSLTSSPVSASGTPGDYDDAFRALGSATFSAGLTPAGKLVELERQVERERARLVGGVRGGVEEWWERMAFRQECCAGQLVGFFVVAVGEERAPTTSGEAVPPAAAAEAPAPPTSATPPTTSTSTSVSAPTSSLAPPASPAKSSSHAPAPKRHTLSLRPAQYTKHWSTLHNFDYALAALPRLAGAVRRWSEGLERACWSAEEDAGAVEGEWEGVGAVGGGDGEGRGKEEWRRRYEGEVFREVRVENPLPAAAAPGQAAAGGGGAGGEKRAAAEAPKVNVLAPRKKKKKVE